MSYYLSGAEPFFYRGSSTGCLVLHGFGSSPGEVRWLGQHLAGQGWTVCGPRLAGHGTDYHSLSRTRWQDWYGSLLDAYHMLRGGCEKVVIAGHSMGGLLALLAGASLPVDALLVMAAPFSFSSRLMPYAHLVRFVMPYFDARDHSTLPQILREEQARRGETERGRVRYDRWATQALGELYRLAQTTRAVLHRVQAPLCLIYSAADDTVSFADRQVILDGVGSRIVESHSLEHSGHNLPIDIERETVFALASRFICQQLEVGHS